jgi:hypothetical protein
MINRTAVVLPPVDLRPRLGFLIGSPVALAAYYQDWEALRMLVQLGGHVTRQHHGPLPYGVPLPPHYHILLPASFFVRKGGTCDDRRVIALVEAAAKKEIAGTEGAELKAPTKAAPAASVGTLASNAAEDDSFKRVTTEKEEKQKAKRRAQKKKAKAKKRAAAKEANAGAGKEADPGPDSDSDSSGTDEEEAGMDEEERMLARAPTFDLEKEKAARKARAEAEALEAAKRGKE